MDATALSTACRDLGLTLTLTQIQAFEAFEDALYQANEAINLTRVPKDECWLRHFVDSLLILDLIPLGARVLDIGTGPGFPSWPLACARPDLQVTALDANGKMLGFLRSQLLPNLEIVQARAEEWPNEGAFEVVTGRALAPLPIQLEISARPCKLGGFVLPLRSRQESDAINNAGASKLGLKLRSIQNRTLPGTDVQRLIPQYEKIARTPRPYPRRWADIKRAPLSGL